jgi:hypothetical protein
MLSQRLKKTENARMGHFLQTQFTWDNVASQLLWTAILSGCFKFLTYLIGWSPRKRKALFFWVAVPITLMAFRAMLCSLSSGNRPMLIPSIHSTGIGGVDSDDNSQGIVFLEMWIDNAGSPSVVRDWKATVETPNGKTFAGEIANPHQIPTVIVSGKSSTNTIPQNEFLISKCDSVPIASGGSAIGILVFKVVGASKRQVEESDTKITITFKDVTGKQYELKHLINGLSTAL